MSRAITTREAGRRGARAKWKGTTAEQRRQIMKKVHAARRRAARRKKIVENTH